MGNKITSLALAGALLIGGIALYGFAGNSQNRAENFAQAQRVSATEVVEGYVAVEGTAESAETLSCPFDGGKCAYIKTTTEEYTSSQQERCGTLDDNMVIIEYQRQQCSGSGETESCEDCYWVEEYEWSQVDKEISTVALTMGGYTVTTTDADFNGTVTETLYDDPQSELDPYVGDFRTTIEYLPLNNVRLVSGVSNTTGTIADGGKDKPLLVSTRTYEALAEDLERQDNSTKWLLRIAGIVLAVLGAGIGASSFKGGNSGGSSNSKNTLNDLKEMAERNKQ